MSGWSQPLMSSHMMHPQLQAEQSAFSQHQPMEQDDTGIANPANNFHQPQHMPNTYMDFPKVKQSNDYVQGVLSFAETLAFGSDERCTITSVKPFFLGDFIQTYLTYTFIFLIWRGVRSPTGLVTFKLLKYLNRT